MAKLNFQQKLQDTLEEIVLYNKQKSKFFNRDENWLKLTKTDIKNDILCLRNMIDLHRTTKDLIITACREFTRQYKKTKNPDHNVLKTFQIISKVDEHPTEVGEMIENSVKCKTTREILKMLVNQIKVLKKANEEYQKVLQEGDANTKNKSLIKTCIEQAIKTGDVQSVITLTNKLIEISILEKKNEFILQITSKTYNFIEKTWVKFVGTLICFAIIYFFYTFGKPIAEGIEFFAKYFNSDRWFEIIAGERLKDIMNHRNMSVIDWLVSFRNIESYTLDNLLMTSLSTLKTMVDPGLGLIEQLSKIGNDAIYSFIMIFGCLLGFLAFLLSTISNVSFGFGMLNISMGNTIMGNTSPRNQYSSPTIVRLQSSGSSQKQRTQPKTQRTQQKKK